MSRPGIAVLFLLFAASALAQDKAHPSAAAAASMRAGVEDVLSTLSEKQRGEILRPFDDADRLDWHYTPRSRGGLSFKEMDKRSREAVHALLRTALSAPGYRKVVNIIELELVLRELETFGLMRDPERYHLTIYGMPDAAKRWGWRFEGHHLSLNFTLDGEKGAADTPSFFGANPAAVASGARKGLRALGAEHDAGWRLLESLGEAERREAVISARTYGDIVTGSRETVEPLEAAGLGGAKMSERSRALLWQLVETYAASFEPGLAQARLARAQTGGIEAIRFAWAGSTTRGAPHYYRVQGPAFLIEYDASQSGGNHIHTVWRDFRGDFGRDLLREHYGGNAHR